MSAQEQGKYERDFTVCKNKFRGLASDFKSKKFVKNRRFDPSYIFRSGYRDLMLEARSVLHPSKYSEYLNWVSFHIKNQLPELSRYPTEYDELAGVSVDAPTISLEKEILWIVARIKENSDVINSFREISTHIEKLVINNEFSKGIDVLKKIEMLLGASFWSIQLRISLENLTGEYLNWVSFHIKNQLPELSRYPTEYDELAGVSVDAPTISLEKEILWIVARIKENSDVINSFREISTHIEKLVINNEFSKGIDVLKKIEMLLGASFWSIQLRISLENLTGGLENQKKYTSEVRSIYRKGLLNFIAYNTSIRNILVYEMKTE
ncbi:hypothetical protein [Yersinia enterocolitica]|uniref:hypothetical protein n=1 Tax=Yersinia enterocolitica TaxID=630 RepID=UPI0002DD504A|nr:hypothetical protein [Yersinia enterocolitica]